MDLEISGGAALRPPVYTVYGSRGALVSTDGNDLQLKYLDPKMKMPRYPSHEDNPPLSGGFPGDVQPKWIRETIMADPESTTEHPLENHDIYHLLYQAVRERKPFLIKPEEAFEVVRVTCMVKEQNPAFKGIEDEFGK